MILASSMAFLTTWSSESRNSGIPVKLKSDSMVKLEQVVNRFIVEGTSSDSPEQVVKRFIVEGASSSDSQLAPEAEQVVVVVVVVNRVVDASSFDFQASVSVRGRRGGGGGGGGEN